jgi:hypothetical protein
VLVQDHDSAIVSAELLKVFNRWLRENGHNEWSNAIVQPLTGS